MTLPIELQELLCVICGGENGTNECHLAAFSADSVVAHHFMATHVPPSLPLYGSASDIVYASKNLSRMVGNLAT